MWRLLASALGTAIGRNRVADAAGWAIASPATVAKATAKTPDFKDNCFMVILAPGTTVAAAVNANCGVVTYSS